MVLDGGGILTWAGFYLTEYLTYYRMWRLVIDPYLLLFLADPGIGFPPDCGVVFAYDPEEPTERVFVPGTVVNHESIFWLSKIAGVSAIIDTIAIDEKKAELLSIIPQQLIAVED